MAVAIFVERLFQKLHRFALVLRLFAEMRGLRVAGLAASLVERRIGAPVCFLV